LTALATLRPLSGLGLHGKIARLSPRGLEQLDRVSGRVVEQDLFSAVAVNDVIPEVHARTSQPLHFVRKIIDP
jgi:hypothetical protein